MFQASLGYIVIPCLKNERHGRREGFVLKKGEYETSGRMGENNPST